MDQIDRRALLALAASAPILAACPAGQIPLYVSAIQSLGQDALLVMPQLTAAGLSGNAASTAANIVNGITAAAGIIGATSTQAQGATALTQIELYINALAPFAASFAGLVPGGSMIGLIVAALPAIEEAVNLVVTLITNEAKSLAATAPKPAAAMRSTATVLTGPALLTPNQALAELLRQAGR